MSFHSLSPPAVNRISSSSAPRPVRLIASGFDDGEKRPETLGAAWSPQIGRDHALLPYGIGWFVQSYNGEPVVWQFGQTENASSSLMITLPSRGLTLILLANSDGLTKAFPLSAGDVSVSPFARVFLGLFAR